MTMNDGTEVLAKIPNPNAGPSFYTTASEVATRDFVSGILCTEADVGDADSMP